MVKLVVPERDEQPVRHKLDVLAHQRRVHTDQGDGQRVGQELLLDLDGFGDDACNAMRSGTTFKVRKEEAGKVGVEAFVTRDELVLRGEGVSMASMIYIQPASELTEKVKPGISPRFLSQKMDANDPEKNMPSTAANAMSRSPNTAFGSEIHRNAQSAFFLMQGTVRGESRVNMWGMNEDCAIVKAFGNALVSMALKSMVRSSGSRT